MRLNLTQAKWQKVLSVIQNLNDSLDDSAIRENAGNDLLDLLSADHFASYIWDEKMEKFTRPVFLNMSDENLEFYEKYYQFHDPITHQMQQYHRAVSVNEIIEQRDLVNTEFFNDFLSKDGLYYGINIYVYDNGNQNIGDFRIWRSKDKDNFSPQDLKILDIIAPHFRNAMRNIAFAKHIPPSVDMEIVQRKMADEFCLTKRELMVATELLNGGNDKTVSDKLHISTATLRTHIQHIYGKVQVNSRTEFCKKILFSND